MRSFKIVASIFAVLSALTYAKVGVGPCPDVKGIPNLFRTGGSFSDGRYHLMRFDTQFKWGWDTFAKLPNETLSCQSANITKTEKGFSWIQNKPVDAFAGWPTTSNCDTVNFTCASYFPGKRLIPIYYDPVEPTVILYQCLDLKYAADYFVSEFNVGSFWSNLISSTYNLLGNMHYSLMLVASQNPANLSSASIARVDKFINSFSDAVPKYKPTRAVSTAAKLFSWDGKYVYGTKDLDRLDQTRTTCKW